MTNIKMYITCPNCGRRLCRAKPCSEIETQCPQCKETVQSTVDEKGAVTSWISDSSNTDKYRNQKLNTADDKNNLTYLAKNHYGHL